MTPNVYAAVGAVCDLGHAFQVRGRIEDANDDGLRLVVGKVTTDCACEVSPVAITVPWPRLRYVLTRDWLYPRDGSPRTFEERMPQ